MESSHRTLGVTTPGATLARDGTSFATERPPPPSARKALTVVLVGLVVLYQRVVSPWLPDTCRYEPSCSRYARDAVEAHGPFGGAWLAIKRVGRCHPFGGRGHDPVPPAGGVGRDERET